MTRVRTEAAISLSLVWDPRQPLEPTDYPVIQNFLGAFRSLAGLKGVKALGDVGILERALSTTIAPEIPSEIPVTLADAERITVQAALNAERGHRVKAAARLGVSRRALFSMMQRHGLVTVVDGRQR